MKLAKSFSNNLVEYMVVTLKDMDSMLNSVSWPQGTTVVEWSHAINSLVEVTLTSRTWSGINRMN